MRLRSLVLRGLTYYWRTHVAVVIGFATAVAVLSGALMVGDSVRGSLRDLVLERLGNTGEVVISSSFVREGLADEILADNRFSGNLTPMIVAQGYVTVQGGNGTARKVAVYGVDDRFWRFHNVTLTGPVDREAFLSPALAVELAIEPDTTILVRTQKPSDIPLESLHGRKEDSTSTVRAVVKSVLTRQDLGDFALQAQQGDVRAIFLPLALLQRELDVESRVNTLLVSGSSSTADLETLVRDHATLEDLGLRLRQLDSKELALESESGLISNSIYSSTMASAGEEGLSSEPLFTYLANSIGVKDRTIPYSLVTAMNLPESAEQEPYPIVLNEWAARDLRAVPGDDLTMEYYLWEEPGQLVTRSARFRVARIVPTSAGDSDMAPVYPGITNATSLRDWDPPFPIDLRRVRPIDEAYWDEFSTTPKAFVPLQVGQKLWQSRYGQITSVRFRSDNKSEAASVEEVRRAIRAHLDPFQIGVSVQDVRSQSLNSSRGATDFGEYFVYFSFFLVISALLLGSLFFKLNVEQRIKEVGLLRAVGLAPVVVRRIFLLEGLSLSVAASVIGVGGGLVYAAGIVVALRTWWIGAVGTSSITLHASPSSIVFGAIGGVAAALVCIRLTLRSLGRISERGLLAGQLESKDAQVARKWINWLAVAFLSTGAILVSAGSAKFLSSSAAFFGGGFCFLVASLMAFRILLSKRTDSVIGVERGSLMRLGLRNASFRPVRSVVAIATIASATFTLIAVDSFRKGAPEGEQGGYRLLAETLVPVAQDLNSQDARTSLGLDGLNDVHFEAFRVRPGDDASCLNLYEPTNPRIMGVPDSLVRKGGFSFQGVLSSGDADEIDPWLLLERMEPDGAIPVIADANSMTYVLHRSLGEDFVIMNHGEPLRLRFVAALSDSIFQSELLMSEENFLRLFPEQQGYSFFLVESPPETINSVSSSLEDALASYGMDVTATATRLAQFHEVENTYLSTFQMLGAFGLLLGTIGLAAVLLRSILERRRELALLRVLGYQTPQFLLMVLTENALLLLCGLVTGVLCALIAIEPALGSQGGHLPAAAATVLLAAILGLGILISVIATRVAVRGAVLAALRSE